jgi:hypothetical protein
MAHTCYACSSSNPDRVFSYDGGDAIARFPLRFNGPPGSANGGIAVGALACPALRALDERYEGWMGFAVSSISGRLSAPALLDRPYEVHVGNDNHSSSFPVTLSDGNAKIIVGFAGLRSGLHEPPPGAAIAPPLPPFPERGVEHPKMNSIEGWARVAAPNRPPFFEETGDHPIPGCFSCGPEHESGLHIYPHVVDDGVTYAPWHASEEYDDGDGSISPMIIASALDCSSGICMPIAMQRQLLEEDRFFVLGSLEVTYLRRPPVGRDYRVIAKAGARDGRKFFGRSALFDDAGTPYATADATWIIAGISRTEAFGVR